MSSNIVDIVYMDVEMTWDCKCVIFAEVYVGLECNKTSRFKPSLMPYHPAVGEIR